MNPARFSARTTFPAVGLPVLARAHVLNGDHVPHDHDFLEAVLILGGEGRHRTVTGEEPLRAGDAFLMRPGAWHAYAGCRALGVYNCCFGAGLLERELAPVAGDDPLLHALLWSAPLAPGARGVVRLRLDGDDLGRCRAHLDAIATAGDCAPEQAAHLLLFLTRLARRLGEATPTPAPRRLHPAVRAAVGLLEGAPADEWTLERLSGRVCLEKSHLTRLFKAATGLPPMAYLARRRAEEAAGLLLRTDLSVAEVGERVGWPDPNYFARRFRAHFGVSATAYRRRHRPDTNLGEPAADPTGTI
jgi:AraC family L-rhamnose operon transcriptional activator RhaR